MSDILLMWVQNTLALCSSQVFFLQEIKDKLENVFFDICHYIQPDGNECGKQVILFKIIQLFSIMLCEVFRSWSNATLCPAFSSWGLYWVY